jgi:hypothetical protein
MNSIVVDNDLYRYPLDISTVTKYCGTIDYHVSVKSEKRKCISKVIRSKDIPN